MRANFPAKIIFCLLVLLLVLVASTACWAAGETDDVSVLLTGEPTSPSTTVPRPASKIAENVTVITAADIARINAHTLADVLQTIPGIQLDHLRTPSSWSFFNIQGAYSAAVLVLMDGVRLNDFGQNMLVPGLIPVQQIERIEIIKGAASAVWGSALGGVINIITKTPEPERQIAGMASASIGEHTTADTRMELNGTVDRLDYYLSAGNLYSKGLLPNNGTNLNQVYSKLAWQLPDRGKLTAGFSYLAARLGMDEGFTYDGYPVHDDAKDHFARGFLQLTQPLAPRLNLELLGYVTDTENRLELNDIDFTTGVITPYRHFKLQESSRGLKSHLFWGDNQQSLVVGAEYGHAESRTDRIDTPPDQTLYDSTWDHWALYANGTYSFGPLTVLPGVRYDHTGVSSEYTSFTLGATLQLTDKTLLRGYAARGFSLPKLESDRGLMKVVALSGGIESAEIPGLWLKGTYFHNQLRDIQQANAVSDTNREQRQGVELEARTIPLYGLSLSSGYTFTYAKNMETGERLETNSGQSVPPHLLKVGLHYDNTNLGLKGSVIGNYVDWNVQSGFPARSGGMVWDLFLTWQMQPHNGLSPEIFFSGRNLFDNIQSADAVLFPNTPQWFEGGLRFKF